MSIFLTKLHINKIFHLQDLHIEISTSEKKHLILTGKNGCGKTSVLEALVEFLQRIKNDKSLTFLNYRRNIFSLQKKLEDWERIGYKEDGEFLELRNQISTYQTAKESVYGKIEPEFSDLTELSRIVQDDEFVLAFYGATRETKVNIPLSPEKPNLEPVFEIKETKVSEFLKFLVDLKIQEALATIENKNDDAKRIKKWFASFEALLNGLFEGEPLTLNFNYRDYSFTINQGKKSFGFNQLSDGYSAIIDIIADLILKMQTPNSLTRAYEKGGIVLIDEIETHLHLELQKAILPMLTRVFPNVQFIVTTHSPFVLSSLKDAVAYDLEKRERLEDLTEYSYEALAEGYFEVTTDSNYLQTKLNRFKELSQKSTRDTAEAFELNKLQSEFDNLDETLAPPHVKAEYLQIKLNLK